jgi:hypothetical protein
MLVLSRVLGKDTAGWVGDREEIQKKITSMLPNPLHIPKGYLWEDGKLYKLIQKALL